MTKNFGFLRVGLTAGLLALGSSAQAITFFAVAAPGGTKDPGIVKGETIVANFDTAPAAGVSVYAYQYPATGYTGGMDYTVCAANSPGCNLFIGKDATAPKGDTTNYLSTFPTAKGIIDFSVYKQTNDVRGLSFYAGSLDGPAFMEFFDSNNTYLGFLSTSALGIVGFGTALPTYFSDLRIYVNFAANEDVAGIRFATIFPAFEIDDFALTSNIYSNPGAPIGGTTPVPLFASVPDAVPEPATWAMMIFGFVAVGTAMRRHPKLVTFS